MDKKEFGRMMTPVAVFLAICMALTPSVSAYITGLSYTNIRYDSVQKLFLIDWSSGGTDQISGYIGTDEFESQSGTETKQNFNIQMTTGDEYGKYSYFLDSSKKLYHVQLESKGAWFGDLTTLLNELGCVDITGDGVRIVGDDYAYTNVLNYITVYCARWAEKEGDIYVPNKKQGIWTSTWTFNAEGKESVSKTLSNDDAIGSGTSTNFMIDGKEIVKIKWYGSISTGQFPPEYSNILVIKTQDASGKIILQRVIDESSYNQYDSYVKNQLGDCISDWASGTQYKEACELSVNNRINGVKIPTSRPEFSGAVVEEGFFTIDLNEDINLPSFQVVALADCLDCIEIVIPTGEPEVTSLSSTTFQEDSIGYITAVLSNVGDGDGDFELNTQCPSEFSVTGGNVPSIVIPKGQSITRQIQISGHSEVDPSTQQTIQGICTVTLKERTTQETDSKTVSVTFIQATTCITGNTWKTIENGVYVVKKCTDGYNTITILTCAEGEDAIYLGGDQWQCQITIDPFPAICGNNICETTKGENLVTCSIDCGVGPTYFCGNQVCETDLGENNVNCPQDCFVPSPAPQEFDLAMLGYIALIVIVVIFIYFVYREKSKGPKPIPKFTG